MVIQHMASAMNAQRQYKIILKGKAKHTEKLASGYRINRAADDAAGLTISEKMRWQIRGLSKGVDNTQDGISLCQVADGALMEMHSMLQRMEELSVQAANDTNTKADRQAIQSEVDQLVTEIDRISSTTMFNTQNVFARSDSSSGLSAAGGGAGNSSTGGTTSTPTTSTGGTTSTPTTSTGGTTSTPTTSTGGVSSSATPIVVGNFTITGGTNGTDYSYSSTDHKLTILTSTAIKIQNTTPSTATNDTIYIADGVNANITLAGVNISSSTGAAFEIAENSTGNVTLTLVGDNTLISSAQSCAALQKNGGTSSGTLRITGSGSLTVQGGYDAAGIGSSRAKDTSNIVIESGTITAKGGKYGAGIGGSGGGGSASNITITGGTVTAQGGDKAAGIGGGSDNYSTGGNGSNIAISGGTVNATGGGNGSGIGGGTAGDGATITISGGTVTATGGYEAAGIGGGNTGSGSNITISGGTVTATGGGSADAIGSGGNSGQGSSSANVQRTGGVINENGVETLRLPTITTSSSDSVNRWWIQCGAQNGVGVFLEIDAISARQLGVVGLDVTTFQKASSAMDTISTAVDLVSAARSKIGAQQNRLEHTVANEDNIVENMTDAESRIRDADMAEEMTAYSTANIIAQAVEAMIAQANSSTEGILTLLG